MDRFARLKLRPRGKAWFAVAGFIAVACTGVAVAIAAGHPATIKSVDATFTATTIKNRTVQTCTGDNGDSYEVTHATYTGESSSDESRLDGPIEIRVKSIYNTTKDLGSLEGNVKVKKPEHGDKAHGKLSAVNTDGTLEGFLKGGVHDPGGKLFANASAGFTSAGGFTDGKLGTGSATNTAIIFSGGCPRAEGPKGPKGATGPKGPKGKK
jgi:hypothetical protein